MSHRSALLFFFFCCWAATLPACNRGAGPRFGERTRLRVGASPVPHAEILKQTVPFLRDHNIDLEVVVFTDYVQPNLRLADGDLDANYYQTQAYLDIFEAARHQQLVSMAQIHAEPFGLYSRKLKALAEVADGARVAIPNEASNGYRALSLLEQAGLVELDPARGRTAGVRDIVRNPRHLSFLEVDAAMLPRVLGDVAIAGINTNFALSAGLLPRRDALAVEGRDTPYTNILAVRRADLNRQALKCLVTALGRPEVRQYVEAHYHDSIEMAGPAVVAPAS